MGWHIPPPPGLEEETERLRQYERSRGRFVVAAELAPLQRAGLRILMARLERSDAAWRRAMDRAAEGRSLRGAEPRPAANARPPVQSAAVPNPRARQRCAAAVVAPHPLGPTEELRTELDAADAQPCRPPPLSPRRSRRPIAGGSQPRGGCEAVSGPRPAAGGAATGTAGAARARSPPAAASSADDAPRCVFWRGLPGLQPPLGEPAGPQRRDARRPPIEALAQAPPPRVRLAAAAEEPFFVAAGGGDRRVAPPAPPDEPAASGARASWQRGTADHPQPQPWRGLRADSPNELREHSQRRSAQQPELRRLRLPPNPLQPAHCEEWRRQEAALLGTRQKIRQYLQAQREFLLLYSPGFDPRSHWDRHGEPSSTTTDAGGAFASSARSPFALDATDNEDGSTISVPTGTSTFSESTTSSGPAFPLRKNYYQAAAWTRFGAETCTDTGPAFPLKGNYYEAAAWTQRTTESSSDSGPAFPLKGNYYAAAAGTELADDWSTDSGPAFPLRGNYYAAAARRELTTDWSTDSGQSETSWFTAASGWSAGDSTGSVE